MSYLPKLSPTLGSGLGGMPKRNSVTINLVPRGEAVFAHFGSHSFTVPDRVKSICCVCISGGGQGSYNGGGSLAWKNDIKVNPGETITVVVGRYGYNSHAGTLSKITYSGVDYCIANGNVTSAGGLYDTETSDGGGNGGPAGSSGGNCGGYTSNGSTGGTGSSLYGLGTVGSVQSPSSGSNYSGSGGNFGGGAYYGSGNYCYGSALGGGGAVRIIWGRNRAFPSTDVGAG